jgi:hypothetical protein
MKSRRAAPDLSTLLHPILAAHPIRGGAAASITCKCGSPPLCPRREGLTVKRSAKAMGWGSVL